MVGVSFDVELPSVSLAEMELVYKSDGPESLLEDPSAVTALPNVKYVPLKPDVALASVHPRKSTGLSFLDSLTPLTTFVTPIQSCEPVEIQ